MDTRRKIRDLAKGGDFRKKFHVANLAELLDQPDLAEEIYRNILFNYPDHSKALYSLGLLYFRGADRASILNALSYFERALKQGYELPGVYNQIGLAYWQLRNYSQAEEAWRKALKLDRNNGSALDYLRQLEQFRLKGRF